jgi:hypothetical protein
MSTRVELRSARDLIAALESLDIGLRMAVHRALAQDPPGRLPTVRTRVATASTSSLPRGARGILLGLDGLRDTLGRGRSAVTEFFLSAWSTAPAMC